MEFGYRKNGALVTINGKTDSLDVQVVKNDEKLTMHLARKQREKSETYVRSMGGGAAEATRGDVFSQYLMEIGIGGESKKFEAEFSGYHFDDWGTKAPTYNVSLEKGLPNREYTGLLTALSSQNTAVARVFETYVLDAENLQKTNNVAQSIFNQKLDAFLSI